MKVAAVIKDGRGRITKADPTFAAAFLMLSSRNVGQSTIANNELARSIVRFLGGAERDLDIYASFRPRMIVNVAPPAPGVPLFGLGTDAPLPTADVAQYMRYLSTLGSSRITLNGAV